jgi:hypothetical protein
VGELALRRGWPHVHRRVTAADDEDVLACVPPGSARTSGRP